MLVRNAPVSIDIGSQSVKVAQVGERRGAVRTIRCAEQALPAGFRWEAGADPRPLVEAIRLALARAGIRASAAVFSLPRRQVTARIGAFPPADRAALRRVVEYDLADHIPFPVDQVVMDFQVLGPSQEQPGLADVLVVAAPRELVRQYLDLAHDLGLTVAALTVDALALDDLAQAAALCRGEVGGEGPRGLTLTVEVGARATTINVSQGRRLRLTRSVGLGGHQLTLAIRDDLGITQEEAERLKVEQGVAILTQSPQAHRTAAWLENLRGELRRSVLTIGPAATSRLLLAGAASQTPGLTEALAVDLGVEPVPLSVASLFPQARVTGTDAAEADRCLLAIGLSLRAIGRSAWELSLLPREVSQLRRARRLRRAGIAAAALVVLALAGGYEVAARNLRALRLEVRQLEREAKDAERIERETKSLREQRDRLREQLDVLDPARRSRLLCLELLKAVSEVAPRGVVLTHFTLRPNQPLVVNGTAPDSLAVADLQAGLARVPLVTSVFLNSAEQSTDRERQSASLSFSMTVHLLGEEEAPRSARRVAMRGGAR